MNRIFYMAMLLVTWLSFAPSYADNVARIGDVEYASLAEAVAAVPDNSETTIMMIGSEALNAGVTIAANKNIVLDLNGNVLSGILGQSGTTALITNRGTLTIKDSSVSGNGKITNTATNPDSGDSPGYASNTITNNGKLTIESGYIESATTGGYAAYTVDNQTNGNAYTPELTINGGKLYNKATDAIRMFLNSDTKLNKVVINGGVIDSDKSSGRVIVVQDANAKLNKGELDITGGEIQGVISAWSGTSDYTYSDAQYEAIKINITGGKIEKLDFADYMTNTELRAQSLKVTGGVYNESPDAYVTSGYVVVDNDDATYKFKVERQSVAQIGDVKYATLADAVAAVPTDGTETTITMIGDETVAGGSTLTIAATKNIVLDLNGKTITGSSTTSSPNFYFITNKGTLEITDNSEGALGKITYGCSAATISNEYVTICNEGGTFTLTNGTIENTSGGLSYAVNNRSVAQGIATFNLNGGTISAPNGDAALRVYQSAGTTTTYSDIVNINGGTILDKGIFVDEYISSDLPENYDGSNVTVAININGGTVNGLIDFKMRHPFGTSLNITDGVFGNAKLWVRKYTSEYKASTEPTAPIVHISGGKFSFANNKAFGLAYDCGATSWTSYTQPYDVSDGVFNVNLNNFSGIAFPTGKTGVANTDSETSEAYPYTVGVAPVAQIGSTTYPSLAEAIADVPANGTQTTITMLADEAIAAGLTVAANQNIVLELAGHVVSEALSQSGTTALITNKGTLVIQDNTDTNKDGTGTGKISYQNATPDQSSVPGYASNTIINHGNLTIESGYVENTTSGGYAAYTVDNVTNGNLYTPVFTMNGGKLYNSYTDAVRMFLNSTANRNKVVINGGVLNSDKASGRVIVMHMPSKALGKGELDITGGTINGKVNAWSAANAGGVEDRFSDAQYANVSINITGGNIDAISFTEMANTELRANSLIVTGGTYKVSPAVYVTSGYEAVDNGDGTFTVQKAAVAKIGETGYATLQDAFDAVGEEQTIVLQGDLTQDNGVIFNRTGVSSKLDLNNHTLTVNSGSNCNSRAVRIDAGTLEVYGGTIVAVGSGTTSSNGTGCYGAFRVEANGKLNAHDLTLTNARPWGLNVKICGGEAELTNVTINSSYGGGIEVTEADLGTQSQAGKATVTDCSFTQSGYFDHCSTALSVSGGSELTVNGGTFQSENYVIYVFSSGGYVTVNGGTYTDTDTATDDKPAFVAAIDTNSYPNYTGGLKLNGGTFTGSFAITSPASTVISGGTFSKDPSEFCAPGYGAAKVEDENVWKVGPVTVTGLEPQGDATETAAKYTATTVVTDENNVKHEVGTNQTVSVAVVKENNVGEDVKLSDFKMNEVVTKAVVAANTEDNIDVQLIVKAAEPVVSGETVKTVTFEVHPEAIITVNGGTPTNVELTNDDLAQDATFTFVLDVTGRFSNGAAIKVVHKSERPDETFYSTVIDGKVTVSGITHFSDFELSEVIDYVAQVGDIKFTTLEAAFDYATQGSNNTVYMLHDVTIADKLIYNYPGTPKVTLHLNNHTLYGRTNIMGGSLHIEYGHVVGGSEQALNVYGSSDSTAVDYSRLIIGDKVDVTADDYAICLFGATAKSNGYGARVDIDGINATVSSVNDGTVFVSGNLGNGISGDQHNVVNINNGTVTSTNNAAVALHGNATVNVQTYASITGHTGIAVKRGTLNVAGGTIVGNGEKNTTPAPNGNGTELTGAGISVSPTYSQYGPMSVVITGGEVQSSNAVALFKQEGDYVNDATIAVSGGIFSSEVPEEFCAEGYRPIDHGNGIYSVTEIEYEAQLKHGESYVNYPSLQDALAAAADGDEVYMMRDVTLSAPLNVELAGKAVTLDLGAHTLTGRTNLKSGSLTLTNGYVAGGDQQALNVYGSSASNATNYSVLTIDNDVNVTANVYGVCLFGATYSSNGYGAVVNINGRVVTGGDGESGAVFVSGNLGKNNSGDMNNVVNITGVVTSSTDAGVALNGNATVNVLEGASVMGATGIAVKRGTLNMTGGHVYADGDFNPTPGANNNGTEMTGAGISMSPTYSQYGPMSVVITGGEVQTYGEGSVALFKQTGTYQSNATFSVSGGLFSSAVPAEFCAEGYQPKYDQASGKYTVATFEAIWADRNIELRDGYSYEYCVGEPVTQDVVVNSVTYIRNLDRVDCFRPWYVPFDYTLTNQDFNYMTFYRINLIANAEFGDEVQSDDKIFVYLSRMNEGDVLRANRPYVWKAKQVYDGYEFRSDNSPMLYAPVTDSRLQNSTTSYTFDFYGTYSGVSLQNGNGVYYYYVDKDGYMGRPVNKAINLGPYRWYIKSQSKGTGAYYAPTFVFTDDSDVTGIENGVEVKTVDCYYDLKGMKIEKPGKGAYLVKFKDGTVKKVVK